MRRWASQSMGWKYWMALTTAWSSKHRFGKSGVFKFRQVWFIVSVCMYVWKNVCMKLYVHLFKCMRINTWIMYVCKYAHMYVCMYVCMWHVASVWDGLCMYVCMYLCIATGGDILSLTANDSRVDIAVRSDGNYFDRNSLNLLTVILL